MDRIVYSANEKFLLTATDLCSIEKVNVKKQNLMNYNNLVIYDKKNKKVLFEIPNVYPQHYYPHTILDYANVIKHWLANKNEELPILSISIKDQPHCDFSCKECFAVSTRKWAIDNFNRLDIETYKNILKQISIFSKERGVDSVRLEFCGEGNPDLYKDRCKIIEYAKKECNMSIVYISTGSQMSTMLKDTLAKYASFIRISFPGISNEAYEYYSNQNTDNKHTYSDSINLLSDLAKLRKKYKREEQLLIGTRTCMRRLNNGNYISFCKELGRIGIDCLQIVKVITEDDDIILKNTLDKETRKELLDLQINYKEYGLKHLQIPKILDKLYIDRTLEHYIKPTICYSSMMCPILYDNNLIVCTHWDKIKNKKDFHYGELTGKENEIQELMYNDRAKQIRKLIPENCKDCCALKDNYLMEIIKSKLISCEDLEDIKFLLSE